VRVGECEWRLLKRGGGVRILILRKNNYLFHTKQESVSSEEKENGRYICYQNFKKG